jgi:GNAT superfamily N-acetyltransferase
VSLTIEAHESADEGLRGAILQPLMSFNADQTGRTDFRPLTLVVRDAGGDVVGGLCGRTVYGWLFVELLYVPESLRGRGLGRELMRRAETEAIARGCRHAWLDTFEFQARGFYERLGYVCFAELPHYPDGFSRFFMKKALGDGGTAVVHDP